MPANLLAQVVFAHKSGLPSDEDVCSFAWTTTGDPSAAAEYVADETENFFTGTYLGLKVGSYMGTCISRVTDACHIKVYELPAIPDGLPGHHMGSPIRVSPFTCPAPTVGSDYPSEVAVVLSFHSNNFDVPEEEGATRPAARHRGRIYIGPLTTQAGDSAAPNYEHRVLAGFRSTIAAAATALMDGGPGGDIPLQWSVWSRKNATLTPIVGGHVDDAFDTQRRRGVDASTRTIWGA